MCHPQNDPGEGDVVPVTGWREELALCAMQGRSYSLMLCLPVPSSFGSPVDISHEPWVLSECDVMWPAWTLERVVSSAFHTSRFHSQGFSHSFLATEN